jgi:hypothetical protein
MQTWTTFAGRVIACHTATYLVAGLTASWLFDYAAMWNAEAMAHMRPLDSPWVAAGPGLQLIRGAVFALCLYPFRSVFLDRPRGWLPLWGLLVGVGVISTYGPSPGSLEGLVYTNTPLALHLRGLPEVLLQPLAFSLCLTGWSRRTPAAATRAWPAVLGTLTALAVLASLAGVLLAPG